MPSDIGFVTNYFDSKTKARLAGRNRAAPAARRARSRPKASTRRARGRPPSGKSTSAARPCRRSTSRDRRGAREEGARASSILPWPRPLSARSCCKRWRAFAFFQPFGTRNGPPCATRPQSLPALHGGRFCNGSCGETPHSGAARARIGGEQHDVHGGEELVERRLLEAAEPARER